MCAHTELSTERVVGSHHSEGEAQLSSFLHNVSVLMNNIFREHRLPLGPCPGKAVKRVRGLGGGIGGKRKSL